MDRPILFSGPMVRAVLDKRKTNTRRTRGLDRFNESPDRWGCDGMVIGTTPDDAHRIGTFGFYDREDEYETQYVRCPYGQSGKDRLWVRETLHTTHPTRLTYLVDSAPVAMGPNRIEWRDAKSRRFSQTGYSIPSIHMPRWASRLTLEITDVRVERVQEITEADAIAEGCEGGPDVEGYSEANPADPYEEYAVLWDHLNKSRGFGWNVNPWVWRIAFSVVPNEGR